MYHRQTTRFFKDREQCPYALSDPEYAKWDTRDQLRLQTLEVQYQTVKAHALAHREDPDLGIRLLAEFVLDFIRD